MTADLESQVRQIAADVLEVPVAEVTPASSPETIAGWDSVRHLTLVLAIEEAIDLQFAPEEIEQMASIGAILATVSGRRDS